jgi:hypothetical protein
MPHHLPGVLSQAATLLRRWDRPRGMGVQLPPSVVKDALKTYTSMKSGNTIRSITRSGATVTFDRSAKACQATLTYVCGR